MLKKPRELGVLLLDLLDKLGIAVGTPERNEQGLARSFYVPIEHCMTGYGFGYGPCAFNPFVEQIKAYEAGRERDPNGSTLERVVRGFRPETVAEAVFGRGADRLPPELRGAAITRMPFPRRRTPLRVPGHPLPWTRPSKLYPPDTSFRENWGNGAVGGHFRRTIETYISIRDHGYRPPEAHGRKITRALIAVVCLKRFEEARYIVISGHHRLAALAVLGRRRVPVALTTYHVPIADYENRANWPVVRHGVYDEETAGLVAESFFQDDGRAKAQSFGLI